MQTSPLAILKLQKQLLKTFKLLEPPPSLTISEWADSKRRLSSEASAEVGQWRTERAEYQRGIMDAISDPAIEEVVVMASSQVGKTEFLLNTIGYFIEHQPSPIMVVQPTLEMSKTFSTDRLSPMVRDTPALTPLVSEAKSKSGDSTILHKSFLGGHITMVGANAPAGLAGRPIRVLLLDEVDRYPFSAGTEGNPIKLATKRTATYWNRKIVMTSTPTVKGLSVIESEFERGDKRYFNVPCPHCGAFQRLYWGQIKWNTDPDTQKPVIDSVHYECEACHAAIQESEKMKMLQAGHWVATHPERIRVASFHINEIYSPWSTWARMVEGFYEAKQHTEDLRVFINTSLGESWDDSENLQISDDKLLARVEDYSNIPDGAVLLTAGVDVQDTYFVVTVYGWGLNEECWVVDHKQIIGSMSQPEIWKELEAYLLKSFPHERGGALNITAACIDSGGHFTEEVYTFAKAHEVNRWHAIKGMAGQGHPLVGKFNVRGRVRAKLFLVGVDGGKEVLFNRLQKEEFGSGYIHFSKTICDVEFMKQMTAEKQIKKFVKGYPKIAWVKIRARNEALDCHIYALAAYRILNPDMGVIKQKFDETHKEEIEVTEEQKPVQLPVRPVMQRLPQRKPGFTNNWR